MRLAKNATSTQEYGTLAIMESLGCKTRTLHGEFTALRNRQTDPPTHTFYCAVFFLGGAVSRRRETEPRALNDNTPDWPERILHEQTCSCLYT